MKMLGKSAIAITLAGALLTSAATPGMARNGRWIAAGIGLAAGAIAAGVAANAYAPHYYDPGYAYAPAYGPAYAYAPDATYYEPAPVYEAAPSYYYAASSKSCFNDGAYGRYNSCSSN
jgi:hypothetical protein